MRVIESASIKRFYFPHISAALSSNQLLVFFQSFSLSVFWLKIKIFTISNFGNKSSKSLFRHNSLPKYFVKLISKNPVKKTRELAAAGGARYLFTKLIWDGFLFFIAARLTDAANVFGQHL